MEGELTKLVDRLDAFGDLSGRQLLTLTPEGQAVTETWGPLDQNGDGDQQHADLAKRTHRLWKVRVRAYLNGLAQAATWQAHVNALRYCVEATGFDAGQFYYAACLSLVESVDLLEHLSACTEAARVAGFITAEEAGQLGRGEAIDEAIDPRPADVEPGPPITGVIL